MVVHLGMFSAFARLSRTEQLWLLDECREIGHRIGREYSFNEYLGDLREDLDSESVEGLREYVLFGMNNV